MGLLKILGGTNSYLAIGCVLIGIGVGSFASYRLTTVPAHRHAEELAGKLAAETVSVEIAMTANKVSQSTIDTLERRLNEIVEARRVEQERVAAELAAREAESAKARNEAARLRAEVSRAWGVSRDCEGYRDLRIVSACADVADRLRQRSIPTGGH